MSVKTFNSVSWSGCPFNPTPKKGGVNNLIEQIMKHTHMRSLKSFKNFCSSSDWVKLDFLLLAFSCKRRHDDTTSSLCSVRCSWPSGNFKARSSASLAIDCTFSPRAFRSNCKGTYNLSPE